MIGITALLLTYNEAPNIGRTLSKLTWIPDVVIVDSMSTDDTAVIAAQFPNVRVFKRPFTTHAEQWNYGLRETGITTEWVLALDADFVLTDAIVDEMQALQPDAATAGFEAAFDYCIDGRPLRGAVYPPVTVLYRRAVGHYEQDGHTQRIRLEGDVRRLSSRIQHDDRKSLTHWLASQARYMRLEAEKLSSAAPADLAFADRLRRLVIVAPPAVFIYSYLVRGGILDGRAGLCYALQRTVAESILSLFLIRHRLDGEGP